MKEKKGQIRVDVQQRFSTLCTAQVLISKIIRVL